MQSPMASFRSTCSIFRTAVQSPTFSKALGSSRHLSFDIVRMNEKAIRQYRIFCENVGYFLSIAEWRSQVPTEVVCSFYAKLQQSTSMEKGNWVQFYTEHMELLLKDMSKLIASEGLYCLIRILKGYDLLLQKFEKVSVNSETIGLNTSGECITWINRHLERNCPESSAFSDQKAVIKAVIAILKHKSEKTCQFILSKIEGYASLQKSTIKQIIRYIDSLVAIKGIKLPINLKYLLKQNRIVQELEELAGGKSHRLRTNKCSTESSTGNPFTMKKLFVQNSNRSQQKQNQPLEEIHHLNQVQKYMRRSSNYDKLVLGKQLRIKLHERNTSQGRPSSQSFSRNKNRFSKEISVKIVDKVAKRNLPQVICRPGSQPRSFKFNKTSQTPTASSMSEVERSSINRYPRPTQRRFGKTHNSILSSLSNKSHDSIVPEEQHESLQSSPAKDNLSNLTNFNKEDQIQHRALSLESNTQQWLRPFNTMNWVKNIDELLSLETRINTSIIQGSEQYIYLQDVQLQKLDKLNRHLTKSRTPSSQCLLEA